ncbi:MAG: FixH family protein [Candidatus Eremiobacteraeota bacterium]|nr:FixH family protein [Candidatus Eremiobacteraeota bacterium]
MKKTIVLIAAALLIAGCGTKSNGSQTTSSVAGPQDIAITTAFVSDPPRKGINTLNVTLKDGAGTLVKGATVRINTTMPSMSMSGPSVVAKDNGDGTYTAHLRLQYATDWQFAVSARAAGKKGVVQLSADVK